MKRLIFTVTVLSAVIINFMFGTVADIAYAVNAPYVVIGEDVWLLDNEGTKLFLMPQTYYARIISMDENYYYVTFNGVDGKIPKGSVSVVGYDGDVKNTSMVIHIANDYAVFTEIKLKSKLEGTSSDEVTVPTTEAITYIGSYKQGDTLWYYVSYGGSYGYIKNTYTDSPELKFENFIPVKDTTDAPEVDEKEQPKEKQPELTKILIIAGVSVVAIIFIIVLFIPRKNKKHKYYYS